MGLDQLYENAWDGGEYQSGATELEPAGTAQTIYGLVGDDGQTYRRGGAAYKSNAALGAAGFTGLWSGYLPVGLRTYFAGPSLAFSRLKADDTTPENISSGDSAPVPFRYVEVAGGLIAVGLTGGAYRFLFYGGSFGTVGVDYGTGTVTVTNGSRTVTGAGTLWLANADAGRIMVGPQFRHVVASIDSATQLTLVQPYAGATAAGAAYSLKPLSPFTPTHAPTSPVIVSVAGRLVYLEGPRVRFSNIGLIDTFAETDYHQPGPQPVALGKLRDTLAVFTKGGVYAASNMSYDLTDPSGNPQQRLDLLNADLIAWGHVGIAPWKGSLVVPALDGVWLMDTASAPVRISDRISDLYLSYVRAGYQPGVAEVFNGHFKLPILTSANVWVDTLVCRMEATHNGAQYSWTQLSGMGAQVTAFAERSSSPPVLLAASTPATSRVLDCTGYFTPTAAIKKDPDGTTHAYQLVTRNIPTGNNVKNAVKYLKVKYLLTADTGDSPTMTCEASADGGAWQTLTLGGGTPTAGANDGYTDVYWVANLAAKLIRLRFTLASAPGIKVQVKNVQLFLLKSGRY